LTCSQLRNWRRLSVGRIARDESCPRHGLRFRNRGRRPGDGCLSLTRRAGGVRGSGSDVDGCCLSEWSWKLLVRVGLSGSRDRNRHSRSCDSDRRGGDWLRRLRRLRGRVRESRKWVAIRKHRIRTSLQERSGRGTEHEGSGSGGTRRLERRRRLSGWSCVQDTLCVCALHFRKTGFEVTEGEKTITSSWRHRLGGRKS
jgi:hypothetical protein